MCMTEGQRRREMRMMYVEIGKFALRVGDTQIERTLLDKYEPYTRVVGYKSAGIIPQPAGASDFLTVVSPARAAPASP